MENFQDFMMKRRKRELKKKILFQCDIPLGRNGHDHKDR